MLSVFGQDIAPSSAARFGIHTNMLVAPLSRIHSSSLAKSALSTKTWTCHSILVSIRSLYRAETNVIKIQLCRLLRIQNSFTALSSCQVYNTNSFTTYDYNSEGSGTPSCKTMVTVFENGKTYNTSTPNVGFTIKSYVAYDGSLHVKQRDKRYHLVLRLHQLILSSLKVLNSEWGGIYICPRNN